MTDSAAGGTGSLFGVGIAGPSLRSEERHILQRHPPRAVILFRRNIETAEELRVLVDEIRGLPGSPFLCVDQEGGPVDRFRDLLGRSVSFHDAARAGLARRAGELAGKACRAFGLQVDLAPVVDREIPGASERFLAGRCAPGDAAEIVTAASEYLHGLHAAGIAGCVKHFPGLGRANLDTHQALPFLPDDPEEEARDLAPFAATMDAAGAVMISHGAGHDGLPASLSHARATALLRGDMGFAGAAFSDDLEMGALAAFGEMPERCVEAARAGCDLLFVCSRIAEYPECVQRVERDVDPERRAEAAARLDRYVARIPGAGLADRETSGRDEILRLRAAIAAFVEQVGSGTLSAGG